MIVVESAVVVIADTLSTAITAVEIAAVPADLSDAAVVLVIAAAAVDAIYAAVHWEGGEQEQHHGGG